MTSISPICKKCKNFISAQKKKKVPYLYRLHDKKIIKIQDIKISHLGTFNKDLSNEPTFSLIHLAGQYLKAFLKRNIMFTPYHYVLTFYILHRTLSFLYPRIYILKEVTSL
jgi:hypothetical protein